MSARRFTGFNATSLVLGLAFLYLPILLLVIYSFNASRLVTVWGGFSTQWYGALFRNQALMDAAWVTIRIALVSATLATVLGTLAALALTRYGRFRGRALFTGMVYAPMVMPEVITGLSLLLLFVAVGFDRGFWTVTLAHTTLTMCFVTVVVQARLVGFDRSLEEAAQEDEPRRICQALLAKELVQRELAEIDNQLAFHRGEAVKQSSTRPRLILLHGGASNPRR